MIGKKVVWTSQSQGSVKTKKGEVIAIINPQENAYKWLPPNLPKSRFKGSQYSKLKRALVAVKRNEQTVDYYAPPLDWLNEDENP